MKKITVILTVFVLISTVSCSSGKKEQILKISRENSIVNLDPIGITRVTELQTAMQMIEGLVTYHPVTLQPQPGVAQQWQVSNLTYTFYLKDDVFWENGEKVTADDFRDSWIRALKFPERVVYRFQFNYIKNAVPFQKGDVGEDELGIQVVDDRTLKIQLERPIGYFLGLLAFPTFYPQPSSLVEKFQNEIIPPEEIIANGPFVHDSSEKDRYYKMVKNDSYYDQSKVHLEAVEIYFEKDLHKSLERYLNGEIDWLSELPPESIQEMITDKGFRKSTYLGSYFILFNAEVDVLKDMRIRQALSYTVDREYICRFIGRESQIPNYGIIPQGMPGYREYPEKEGTYWIKKAKQLFKEAGYSEGEGFPELTFLYEDSESHRKIGEVMKMNWKKHLNVDLKLQSMDYPSFVENLHAGNYSLTRGKWYGDYVDPNTFLELFLTNRANWQNEEFDSLIFKAQKEFNFKTRMKYFEQAEEILVEEAAVIPIFSYVNVYCLDPAVKGVSENILNLHPLKEVKIQ